jgi:hypothetical protein
MYFAVDPVKPELPAWILTLLKQTEERHPALPLYAYLLVDSAFDQNLSTAGPWRNHVEGSLYDDMPLAELKTVGPTLLRLPDDAQHRLNWLRDLIAACAGKPMLSVLYSALPAAALKAHFRPWLRARTTDHLEWPVRWADTRILPALLAILTPAERQALLSPLHAWLAVDRQGRAVACRGEGNPAAQAADFDCWPLDDRRFAQLIDGAEADAVLNQIDNFNPGILTRHSPSEAHAAVARQLLLATRYRIEGANDRQHFAQIGLAHAPALADDPRLHDALHSVAQGADYFAQLNTLPAEFWQSYPLKTPQ